MRHFKHSEHLKPIIKRKLNIAAYTTMSDLLRALPHVKDKETPTERTRPAPRVLTTAQEDPDASSSSDSSASTADSITTLKPSAEDHTTHPVATIPWPQYFSQELYITAPNAIYHVYLTPPSDPAKGPLFICHHGAGASGMSFARFASFVRSQAAGAGVLALEAREHGSVVTDASGAELLDFSLAALTKDAMAMIRGVQAKMRWSALPPSVLVGHSLGGAVATHIAASGELGAQLVGFLVLDVVEGSAIEALGHMRTYLSSRPPSFASVDAAVEWHVRSRTVRDVESAKASVPSLLRLDEEGRWVWKTDLRRTQDWWQEWFTGMSAKFLRGRAAKGLILAGTDRLDRELMVGQMQGKFQLTVLPEAGHFVQEDVPEKMASLALEFFRRNDRSAMVLPPKVADLIAQGKKV